MKTLLAMLLTLTLALPAFADEVEVMMVKATQTDGLWLFNVTVQHPDASSDHMMDSIAIFLPDETRLAAGDIPKPSIGANHVSAQVKDVAIPEGVEYIIIRGHCSNDGWTHDGIIISLL